MLLFSLECSAAAASASLYREGKLLGEEFLNVPQTHSVTLLPMAKSLLEHTGISPAQIDYYAVSRGPGSFTGLRIGIAAIKGLAFPDNTPCVGVSTPEAIAYGLLGFEGTVIPMMDARCGQVYTARFQGKDGRLTRLSEDEALPLSELKEKLKSCPGPLWLCGDGAHLGLAAWGEELPVRMAPAHLCCQRASAVGLAAMQHLGEAVSPGGLSALLSPPGQCHDPGRTAEKSRVKNRLFSCSSGRNPPRPPRPQKAGHLPQDPPRAPAQTK